MPRSFRSSLGRWALGLALAYALILLVTPALHDPSDCFSSSPDRCVACLANPPATEAQVAVALAGLDLPRAEAVETAAPAAAGALLPVDAPGRAPPS